MWDREWKQKYAGSVATAREAAARVKPGQRVFVGTGCGEPVALTEALTARANELADVEIVHLLTLGEAPYARPEWAEAFRVNSFFIAENVRGAVQAGLGDYTPIFLSDIPRLFGEGRLPLDVAFIQVSPPDENGTCSLGVSVDIVKSAAENASLVVAQVNARMPRTLGDAFISVYDLDCLVPDDRPLLEFQAPEPTDVTGRIGEFVAGLVDDGSTIEVGIGRVPQAVLRSLKGKKDLGVHTEMLTDTIVEFVESGACTGAKKTLDAGKIVASFCMGTRKLYDFIDGNPLFSFHPTEYVNDLIRIGDQRKMTAINVALEVDLTGQVCADSLGERFYSGIGGQVDFNRGAARSRGGKAIIALPSTAKGGKVSRIVCRLSPGAGVVTTRGDVHYVVTEHGSAYLHGKCVQDRALALISIAHPDFRETLLDQAIEAKYIRSELADVRIATGPPELRSVCLLDDGTQIVFRAIHPTDEPRMRDLFHNLSRQTIYYRFMTRMSRVPGKQVRRFTYVDHRDEVAVVGVAPEAHGEEIVCLGQYYFDPKTNRAEVAFVVRERWQNRGLGQFMLRRLMQVARRNGIAGFTAEVLVENKPMQRVFAKAPCAVRSHLKGDVYSFELEFD